MAIHKTLTTETIPDCPKCDTEMHLHSRYRGEMFSGKVWFWECPECNYKSVEVNEIPRYRTIEEVE